MPGKILYLSASDSNGVASPASVPGESSGVACVDGVSSRNLSPDLRGGATVLCVLDPSSHLRQKGRLLGLRLGGDGQKRLPYPGWTLWNTGFNSLRRALVSIIIPTYNRAHCVARAVESVLTQTYPRVEVIVVDDGSVDETGDLIARQYGKDPRVVYLYQANAGVCAARNAGFQRARGEYIALLDSDDTWEPWKLELQIACLEAHPEIGMVWTDMTAIGRDGKTVISQAYMRQMYSAYRWFTNEALFSARHPVDAITPALAATVPGATLWTGDIFSQIIVGNLVTTPTVVLTRERLAAVGGFDESFAESGEDHDFHLRTCREGPVGFIDVSSTRVQRGRDDQLSRKHGALARNYLTTVSRALARDRGRVKLPEKMIDRVLAHAHRWVGETLMTEGRRNSEARKHLYRSLRYSIDRRTLFVVALSFVPAALRNLARQTRRKVRRSLAHRA